MMLVNRRHFENNDFMSRSCFYLESQLHVSPYVQKYANVSRFLRKTQFVRKHLQKTWCKALRRKLRKYECGLTNTEKWTAEQKKTGLIFSGLCWIGALKCRILQFMAFVWNHLFHFALVFGKVPSIKISGYQGHTVPLFSRLYCNCFILIVWVKLFCKPWILNRVGYFWYGLHFILLWPYRKVYSNSTNSDRFQKFYVIIHFR